MTIKDKPLSFFITVFAVICFANITVKADIISNPDSNTLWREDSAGAPTGENPSHNHWNGDLDIKAANDALQINATNNKKTFYRALCQNGSGVSLPGLAH
jgi:hypothetical protein